MGSLTLNPAMTTIAGEGRYSVLEYNGNWIKLPNENIEIVMSIVNSGTEESDIVSLFLDQSDAAYITGIIEKLKSIEILYSGNETTSQSLQSVQWAITNKCNLSCIHCCQDAGFAQVAEPVNNEMTGDELYKIARLLCQNDSLETISITGGEPLLCADCKEITTYIRKNFKGKITLMTNGLLINSSNIQWITNNFDHISISLDGSCAELTKLVRGRDIFEIVLSKVRLLQENNFHDISLSAILPDARESVEEFDNLCKYLNVDPMVRSYSMSGRGASGYDYLMNEYDKYIKRNGYERLSIIEDQVISGLNRCSAGITQLTIEPNGNIQPCAVLWGESFTLGNIREIDADEFLGLTRKNSIFDFEGSKCAQCSYKSLCWHCYDEYIYFKQNKQQFNKRCASRVKSIESILWGE